MVFVKTKNARADRVRMVKWVILLMYCKQEPDLRAERRSCNSNFRLIQVQYRMSKFRL